MLSLNSNSFETLTISPLAYYWICTTTSCLIDGAPLGKAPPHTMHIQLERRYSLARSFYLSIDASKPSPQCCGSKPQYHTYFTLHPYSTTKINKIGRFDECNEQGTILQFLDDVSMKICVQMDQDEMETYANSIVISHI